MFHFLFVKGMPSNEGTSFGLELHFSSSQFQFLRALQQSQDGNWNRLSHEIFRFQSFRVNGPWLFNQLLFGLFLPGRNLENGHAYKNYTSSCDLSGHLQMKEDLQLLKALVSKAILTSVWTDQPWNKGFCRKLQKPCPWQCRCFFKNLLQGCLLVRSKKTSIRNQFTMSRYGPNSVVTTSLSVFEYRGLPHHDELNMVILNFA